MGSEKKNTKLITLLSLEVPKSTYIAICIYIHMYIPIYIHISTNSFIKSQISEI